MKINHISIKNVFQHGSLEIPADGNLIGLVGPNGSGKSNLLKCIQFAFSGEVPGKVKEQLLKWGEKSGSVTIDFTHQGKPGVITRATGQGKTSLKYDGETATGITKVNSAVDAFLGMDKDVARTVFVAQDELNTMLFETPAKREQAFQRMLGIGEADKIYLALGAWINAKMPPVFDTSAQIAEGREEQAGIEKTLSELEPRLEHATTALQSFDTQALASRQLELNTIQNHCSRLRGAKEDLAARQKQIDATKAARDAENAKIAEIDFSKLDEKLRTAEQALASAEEYNNLAAAREAKRQELAAIGECPVTAADVDAALEAAQTAAKAVSELQGVSKMYTNLLGALEAADATIRFCPVCGSGITDKESVIERLRGFVTSSKERETQIGVPALESAYRTARATYDGFSSKKQNLEGQLSSADAHLAAKQQPQADMGKLRKELTMMKETAKQLRQVQLAATTLQSRLESEQRELETATGRFTQGSSELASLGVSGDDYAAIIETSASEAIEIGRKLAESTGLAQEKAALTGRIAELRARLDALTKGIDKLVRQNEQNSGYEAVKTTLERVRSWTHYTNGPHKLAVRVMESLTDGVNMFLGRLNAPFYVVLDEDGMSYRCPFTDGRTMPEAGAPEAAELSGGQKALLAVSFRLASYCMFASRQGLLTLDEPSAALDTENVANFCTMLEKLKEIMAQLDLQIFLSTHEQAVLPFVDSVINLYDKESLATQ